MVNFRMDAWAMSDVQALVAPELAAAESETDLSQRLERLGYGVRRSAQGRKLVTLPHGVELMDLPAPAFLAPHHP